MKKRQTNKSIHTIPKGWYKLNYEDIIQVGDKVWDNKKWHNMTNRGSDRILISKKVYSLSMIRKNKGT